MCNCGGKRTTRVWNSREARQRQQAARMELGVTPEMLEAANRATNSEPSTGAE